MTRRMTWGAIAVMASALMTAPAIVAMRPLLIWNATASTPVGLYRLQAPGVLYDGELVALMPPASIASYLAHGGFLPQGVPLLKHIAALPGQAVCRAGDAVTIDGTAAGVALDRDHLGRPLPRWSGCRRLAGGEVFLMNRAVPESLDGRYFGPFPAASVIGRAVPVWTQHKQAGPVAMAHGDEPTASLPPAKRNLP
jgi:conjugative transfer signal peptidase TraF